MVERQVYYLHKWKSMGHPPGPWLYRISTEDGEESLDNDGKGYSNCHNLGAGMAQWCPEEIELSDISLFSHSSGTKGFVGREGGGVVHGTASDDDISSVVEGFYEGRGLPALAEEMKARRDRAEG